MGNTRCLSRAEVLIGFAIDQGAVGPAGILQKEKLENSGDTLKYLPDLIDPLAAWVTGNPSDSLPDRVNDSYPLPLGSTSKQ